MAIDRGNGPPTREKIDLFVFTSKGPSVFFFLMNTVALSDETMVRILPDGEPITLGEFFAVNSDGDLDRDAIMADLAERGTSDLGGGAGAEFTLGVIAKA